MPYIITSNNIKSVNVGFNYHSTLNYPRNDLGSVYTHYDTRLGKNIPTENKLPGGISENGKSGK